jgi:hypothetical protein
MAITRLPLYKRLMFFALLMTFGIGLGACLLEITVRLFFPTSDFLWQWDSRIGMRLVPGMRGRSVKPGIFDVEVNVNSAGFRDREHPVDKPTGTKRIVLLGDSFVEAIQVPFEQSITAQLEDQLNRTTGHIEVINFGVSGTGTARQYLALREYGLRYKPDVVLLFFVGNDFSDNSRRLQGRSYVPYPEVTSDGKVVRDKNGQPVFTPFFDESSRLAPLTGMVKNHWKSYHFLRERIDSSPAINRVLYSLRLMSTPPEAVNAPAGDNFGFYEIYRVEQKPVWKEAWGVTEELLLDVRNLTETAGAKFGVVLVPAAWEVYPALWNGILTSIPGMHSVALDVDQPSSRLTRFLTEHDVTVMNLLLEFRRMAATSPALYVKGDAHWTSGGHKLATDLMAPQVSAMLRADLNGKHTDGPSF